MKFCTKCGQEKELTEFYKNRSKNDGYSSECKTCSLEYRQTEKGRAMHKRHRQTEKYKETRRRYLIHHPEYQKARNAVIKRQRQTPQYNLSRLRQCNGRAVGMFTMNDMIDFGRNSFLTWPKGLAERIEEREDKMACDKTHICLSCSRTLDEEEVRICECGKHTCDACGGDVETIEEYDKYMRDNPE